MIHFKINLRPLSLASLALVLLCSLLRSRTASADGNIALVEVRGKRSALLQKQIERVLVAEGYEIVIVADRDEAGNVLASVVSTVRKTKKKWELTVEVWNGAQGNMQMSTVFRARRPAALAKSVKQKLWNRIGSAVESATPDTVEEPVEEPELDETDSPSETASTTSDKVDITAGADKAKPLSIDATFRLHTQIYSRQFRYQGPMPQALAEFSASTVVAFHLEAEVFPLPNYGVLLSYGYAPSFGSDVSGMSDISFDTSSREFRVAAIAMRTYGIFEPRGHLEYGGQNFTVKGALPLPNVKYRYLRIGAALHAELSSQLSVGATAGFRSLLSTGELESSNYFPELSGSALDASLFVDFQVVPQWHLRASATTTNYTASLNTQPGDTLVAESAKDRYRSLQFTVGYEL